LGFWTKGADGSMQQQQQQQQQTIQGALVAAVIPTRAPYREQLVSTHTMFERLSIHPKQIP
jgi:hypothetical protein